MPASSNESSGMPEKNRRKQKTSSGNEGDRAKKTDRTPGTNTSFTPCHHYVKSFIIYKTVL
jgi:hypothetical protein